MKIKTHTSAPIQAGEITLQPMSQSIHWVGKTWGFVWNRPIAIRVEEGETVYQLPIRDHTRIALILLWGLAAVFGLISMVSQPIKKEQQ